MYTNYDNLVQISQLMRITKSLWHGAADLAMVRYQYCRCCKLTSYCGEKQLIPSRERYKYCGCCSYRTLRKILLLHYTRGKRTQGKATESVPTRCKCALSGVRVTSPYPTFFKVIDVAAAQVASPGLGCCDIATTLARLAGTYRVNYRPRTGLCSCAAGWPKVPANAAS